MTVPLPDNILSATWKVTSLVGHQCRWVQYYADAGTLAQSDYDAYSDYLGSIITAFLSTSSRFDGVDFRIGTGTSVEIMASSVAGAGAGGRGGATVPPQTMVLFKKTTVQAGRHGRGRLYLIDALDADVADNGQINSSPLSDYQGFADDVLTVLPGKLSLEAVWTLYDRLTGTAPSVGISGFTVESRVATQRRRFKR